MRAPELGRPALQGGRLAFHLIGRTSRIVVVDLASGQAATARQERRALLLNPSLQGGRLLYVRAYYARQELRLGPVTRRSPRRDRRLWSTVPTGRRDAGHEPGDIHKQHGQPHKLWKRPARGVSATPVDDRAGRGRRLRDAPAPGLGPAAGGRDRARAPLVHRVRDPPDEV